MPSEKQNTELSLENLSVQSLRQYEEAYFDAMAEDEEYVFTPKKSTHLWGIGYWKSAYDLEKDTAIATEWVEDVCEELLAELTPGQAMLLQRDPENLRSLLVCTLEGKTVGRLPWINCAAIIPMLENGTMQSLDAWVEAVRPDLGLQLGLRASFKDLIRCTVYRMGGDAIQPAVQELGVLRCTMSLDAVKALFELHNRYNGTYQRIENWNPEGYAAIFRNMEEDIRMAAQVLQNSKQPGLDYSGGQDAYFGSFVQRKIQEEPQRYSMLAEYEIDGYARLDEILEQHCLPEETMYWLDGSRVSEDEYRETHVESPYFEVLTLFDGKRLISIPDEQVGRAIYASGNLEALAELSNRYN